VKKFREILHRTVLEDPAVQNLIYDRFYPAELALIPSPEFPCANFAIVPGGALDPDIAKIADINFRIWTWSQISFEESYTIYEAIKNVLHQKRLTDGSVSFVCKETSSPFESYFELTSSYYLMAGWMAKLIEA